MEALQNLTEQLIVLLFVVVGMLMTPIIFIALDYWAGIRKTLMVTTAEIYLARVEKYAVTCTNVTASHKAAINALETVEAVEAYDFSQGYPERLTFSVEGSV